MLESDSRDIYNWLLRLLRVATICSISIFCRDRTHGCDYFGSLRYFVVASSELQLFVRCDILRKTNSRLRLFWFVAILCGCELRVATICSLRYFAIDELTVATIFVPCGILSLTDSELRLFLLVAICC